MTVLDVLTYTGNPANLAPVADSLRLRFVHGDITDRTLVRELVPRHDTVINFAAETHVDRSIEVAAPFVATSARPGAAAGPAIRRRRRRPRLGPYG